MEVVSIHVGQAGIQVGESLWTQYCMEHEIGVKEGVSSGHGDVHSSTGVKDVLFSETSSGNYIPRALFFDLESDVMDNLKKKEIGKMFCRSSFVSTQGEDAANNYAQGHYTTGKEIIDEAVDRVGKFVEACDNIQAFNIFHSVSGGTGSGFASLLLERLSVNHPKVKKLSFTIYPSPNISNTIVEPYNAVLSTHSLLEHTDVTILFDNEALYNIFSKHLKSEYPSYRNINFLITKIASSLTTSQRFPQYGPINSGIDDFCTNITPYPRIHFCVPSYTPFLPHESSSLILENNESDDVFSDETRLDLTTESLTKKVFQSDHLLASCRFENGKFMTCYGIFQGDHLPGDVWKSIHEKRKTGVKNHEFAEWCPTGMKCCLNRSSPFYDPNNRDFGKTDRSVSLVSNHTCVSNIFSRIDHKFDLLYAKRAFVHWWVVHGAEDGEHSEAREDLAALELDYEEVCASETEGEGEGEGDDDDDMPDYLSDISIHSL